MNISEQWREVWRILTGCRVSRTRKHHVSTQDLEHIDLLTVSHTSLDMQDRAAVENLGTLNSVAISVNNPGRTGHFHRRRDRWEIRRLFSHRN